MFAGIPTAAIWQKSGMNPKTLQYLMGHSDIGVTLNTYTHLGAEDAKENLANMLRWLKRLRKLIQLKDNLSGKSL